MTARSPNTLHVAIAGAGKMGARHVRTFDALTDVEVSVIYDPLPAAECDLSAPMRRRCFQSYRAFLERARLADVAVVAGPTATHFGVARDLINCGLPCLVEKPMTVRPQECLMLSQLARARGTGLFCAHIERFNPALVATAGVLRTQGWEEVVITRQNPSSARLSGDSIVTDLMIHDLDIMQHVMGLMPEALLEVEGGLNGRGRSAGEGADQVMVRLQTDAGYPISLTTGRLPEHRARAIHARGTQGSLHVDLLNHCHDLQFADGAEPPIPAVSTQGDALSHQARAMIASVMDGRAHGLASADECWQTLTLCQLIEQRLRLASYRHIRLH
ncbi:Gfo/Idh/MocA family protein [Kushneria indalinina]|uniref:Putative dehydrogenase n=1 Tax=Kushneria indalinina DSM 14324 TaxID=1122140 RepID=A0A3D9DVN3_9GAMM|nr:Gfo/Idh/MocA family oxidoreductase [Kushneria indalinina]REC94822.1 putative dehydrogenase [Kushneria indalinina DSM 14324]